MPQLKVNLSTSGPGRSTALSVFFLKAICFRIGKRPLSCGKCFLWILFLSDLCQDENSLGWTILLSNDTVRKSWPFVVNVLVSKKINLNT